MANRKHFDLKVLENIDTFLFYTGRPQDLKNKALAKKYKSDKIFSDAERHSFLTEEEFNITKELRKVCKRYNISTKDECQYYKELHPILTQRYINIDTSIIQMQESMFGVHESELLMVKKDAENVLKNVEEFCDEYIEFLKRKLSAINEFLNVTEKSTSFEIGDLVFKDSGKALGRVIKMKGKNIKIKYYCAIGPNRFLQELTYPKENFYKWVLKSN